MEWSERKPILKELVWNGFDEDKWHEAYEEIAKYHPDDVVGKADPDIIDAARLKFYEWIAISEWPFSEGKMLEMGSHWGRFCFYKANSTNLDIKGVDR